MGPKRKKIKIRKGTVLPGGLFAIVPSVISAPKFFNTSLHAILETLKDRDFRLDAEEEITDESSGKRTSVSLRLAVSGKPEYPNNWNVSLLYGNKRIDGFGFEGRFVDMTNGILCSGYHRHTWNPKTQEAEGKVLARPSMRAFASYRQFLQRAFKEMRIKVLQDDHDDYPTLF